MKYIKVLHIAPAMKSGGGIEESLIRYFRSINKERIHFDFLANSFEDGDLEKEILESGGRIYKAPSYRKNLLLNIMEKYKNFKKYDYDVIQIHTVGAAMLIDGLIARICGIKKIIFHVHTLSPQKKLIHHICTPLFRILGTDFWACSKGAAKYFFGKSILKKEKFRIINNALDLNQYHIDLKVRSRIRNEFNIEKKFLIGFVGRLSEEKNINFTLDIFFEILKSNSHSALIIVGEGEEGNKLKERVKKLGIEEKVIFTGIRKDIQKVMQGIDVILMPSLYEGLGMVAIEAQALGVKIIVSDKIPTEAKITDDLHFMKLSDSASQWASKALSLRNIKKKNSNYIKNEIQERGYDIDLEVKKLEEYYFL